MRKVFVDTGGWIAVSVKSDAKHDVAVEALNHYYYYKCTFATTDYVLDESYTKLRMDIGHTKTIEFMDKIEQMEKTGVLSVVKINEGNIAKAKNIFRRYSDKDFSFTDCTSFVIMEELEITEAFTTDSHFEQYSEGGFFVRQELLR